MEQTGENNIPLNGTIGMFHIIRNSFTAGDDKAFP
jgi:hypothetical protein